MIKLTRTSGILIPREYENENFYKWIKGNLTRTARMYNKSPSVTYNFFIEGPSFLKIPRYFPVEEYGDFEIEDKIPDGQDIKINHKILLRDEVQKNIINFMLNNNRGIIQAVPGSGKTVTSIYSICEIGKKTFILVHRDNLAEQWIGPGSDKPQGFLAFTDLNKDEIIRLTSKNYKDALQKSIIISTDQTILSLLENHRLEFLTELNKANIGVLFGDEVHTTVGGPKFSECSIHFPVKKTFGLSATPYRWDKNDDIMRYHLGEIFIPEGKASVMDARVTIILFDFGIIRKSAGYVYWGGEFQRSRYLNLLRKSNILVKTCVGIINKTLSDKRNIIVMSERLNFVDLLYDKINIESKAKFVGSAKNEILVNTLVFATPGKIRDGIDIPQKDCLITTSPISNIEQLCGRVCRISEGKRQPIVIELVDIGCHDIKRTANSRLKYYESKNWNIQYLFLTSDGKISQISKQNAGEVINDNG